MRKINRGGRKRKRVQKLVKRNIARKRNFKRFRAEE